MFARLRRRLRAVIVALFDPPCPFGPWSATGCAGCAQDRDWVGSEREDHAPNNLRNS